MNRKPRTYYTRLEVRIFDVIYNCTRVPKLIILKLLSPQGISIRDLVREVCAEEAVSDLAVLRSQLTDRNEEVSGV